MQFEEIKRRLRVVDRNAYPELDRFSIDEIYEGKMGPGGLFLASKMAREIEHKPGDIVLDLGCGNGLASVFLSRTCKAQVFAADLWVPATKLNEFIINKNVRDSVIPINIDITKHLPFAEEYFDTIFCMDSIHYYGSVQGVLAKILSLLRSGGQLCIGSPCFNREFTDVELENLPVEYDDGRTVWKDEFSKYHSPQWWKDLLEKTEQADEIEAKELDDGVIMWEDELKYNIEACGWDLESANRDYSQIAYGQKASPYLTHFILTARKK